MAQVPRALGTLSADMRRRLAAALEAVDFSAPVAEVREACVAAMELYCGPYADMAAELAAEFYDGARELAAGERLGALAESGREPAATDGAVRAIMQDVVEGRPAEGVARKLLDRADYEVKRAAGECVYRNGARDPLDVRYARVPSGGETCAFCIMLASRGFAYRSEATAGGHYHANCDCRIVPGFKGAESSVEGYDPDALYRQWRGQKDRPSTVAYLEEAEKAGEIKYEKPISAFVGSADEKDLAAHVALHRAGYRFTVLAEGAPDGYSNIDLLIGGEKWEVKSPTGGSIRAVESNLRKARRQFQKNYPRPLTAAKVVFNATELTLGENEVRNELLKRMRQHDVDEVLMVTKDGGLHLIK